MITPSPPLPPCSIDPVNPAKLNAPGRDIFDAAYFYGYMAGLDSEQARTAFEAGWAAHADQEHATWATMARVVRTVASAPTFAELEAKRTAATGRPDTRRSIAQCLASWDEVRT